MDCNDCLCTKCDNHDCSNYDARVCDTEEIKYLRIQDPSCWVNVCIGFKKKGD